MKKQIKISYLKKSKKFLTKNNSIITEEQVDSLVVNFIKKHYYKVDLNIDYK